MTTSLLLLLGLLATGAGVYSLFREPDETVDHEEPMSPEEELPTPQKPRGEEVKIGPGGITRGPSASPQTNQAASERPIDASAPQESSQPSEKKKTPSGPFELPYSVDDIIPTNSRYSFHRRPILNSEALVEKKNFQGALQILKRIESRIPDKEIQDKIQTNIQALEAHVDAGEPEPEPQPFSMDDLLSTVKDISSVLAKSLREGFEHPIPLQISRGGDSGPSGPVGPPPVAAPVFMTPPPGKESWIPSGPPPESPWSEPMQVPVYYHPQSYELPSEQWAEEEWEEEEEAPKEKLDLEELDLPDDTFFTDEWEKFKDLPLVDRRGEQDRRKNRDRRGGDRAGDRRTGEDRRKEDLFQERDEYLRRKAEEKAKERDELKKKGRPPLSEMMPPGMLPVLPDLDLEEVGLPDAEDKQLHPESGTASIEMEMPIEEKVNLDSIGLPDPEEMHIPGSEPTSLPSPTLELPQMSPLPEISLDQIGLPDPEDLRKEEWKPEIPSLEEPGKEIEPDEEEIPEIVSGGLAPLDEEGGGEGEESPESPEEPQRTIHGILELKPPEVDDAPFLTLTYDFTKIPHEFRLSKNYSLMEYSYYKYKPMLIKAQEFARRKMLKNAMNYYRVIKSQNIPPELRKMINRNIKDITEFMEKYLMAKGS